MRPAPLLAALPLAALVAGCQSDEARGQAALARLQNRPKAGFVRLVNLSAEKADFFDGTRPLVSAPAPGEASNFSPIKAGDHRLRVGKAEADVRVASDRGTTVILLPDGTTETVTDEARLPSEEANARIVVAKGDGSVADPKAPAIAGPTAVPAGHAPGSVALAPGEYTAAGGSIKVEPKYSYTFLFVPQGGRLKAILLLNTPNQKPGGAGAA